MRVFLTGASGWVGSALTRELLGAGHHVLGVARSENAAASVAASGAEVYRGDLEQPETLKAGAASCDAVIHCAYDHSFTDMAAAAAKDRAAIEAMGSVLAGSSRPFLTTSGTAGLANDRPGTEDDLGDTTSPAGERRRSEPLTMSYIESGVRAAVIRLPPSVHGAAEHHGFVPRLIAIARKKGVSAYVGDGNNRWAAVHVTDAAHLYRLALENGKAGTRYHAIGDVGIPTREIAEAIGKGLGVPTKSITSQEINDHFGWLGHFFAMNVPATSIKTEQALGWKAKDVGLLEDLAQQQYFTS